MKAILKYPLYRRPQPTNQVEAVSFLKAGSVIEVIKIQTGTSIEHNDLWFLADDGFYYWGGGIDINSEAVFVQWNSLTEDIKKSVLTSLVSDKLYWFQKKVQGYIGCGWGYKNDQETNGLAVSVFVSQKNLVPILEKYFTYKGIKVPIDVKEVGRIEHHSYDPYASGKITPDTDNPMQMGGSISVVGSNGYGTRSMVLKNKNGQLCLMSCFHVLLKSFKSQGTYTMLNSKPLFAEFPSRNCNPYPVSITGDLKILEGKYNPYYDFGMVSLSPGVRLRNAFNNYDFNGYYKIEELRTLISSEVQMAGAASTIQKGKVLDVENVITVDSSQIFYNVVVTDKISIPGDSGGPVIDINRKLVGIVIAGDSQDRSYVLPLTFLFTELGYQFL